MKNNIELRNGFIIFLGIGIFFLLMEFLGLANKNYLRVLNVFIVFYGINKTIKTNANEGKLRYLANLLSGFKTGVIGVFLSIIGLIIFIYMKGGEPYLEKLSDAFLFGNDNNIIIYCSTLFLEGIVSSFIGSFTLMQYWKNDTLKD